MKTALAVPLLMLAAAIALPEAALAQTGSRNRSRLPEARAPDEPVQRQPVGSVPDPLAALERELPSLRIDLKLSAPQSALWDSFEREVRDIAEMGRQRLKHPLPALEASETPPPAMVLVGRWADEDRSRSEAMLDLRRKLDSLHGVFTEAQRKEFDRRVYLSQTDPLGSPGTQGEARRRPPSASR